MAFRLFIESSQGRRRGRRPRPQRIDDYAAHFHHHPWQDASLQLTPRLLKRLGDGVRVLVRVSGMNRPASFRIHRGLDPVALGIGNDYAAFPAFLEPYSTSLAAITMYTCHDNVYYIYVDITTFTHADCFPD